MMRGKFFLRSLSLSRKMRTRTEFITSGVSTRSSFGMILAFLARVVILVGFAFLVLFPFFWMINISVMSYEDLTDSTVLVTKNPQDNYSGLPSFWTSFGWSLAVTLTSVCATLVVVLPTSYAFSRINFAGKKILWGLFLMVLALPEVALLSGQYKLVIQLNIRNGPIVIVALFLPYISSIVSMYMLRNAFDQISNNVVEAAMIDGASRTKIFLEIMMPSVRGTIWIVVILGVIASWNSYTWPALLLTTSDIKTLPIWLFRTGIPANDQAQSTLWNVRMAASFVAIVPLMIFYLFFRKRILSSVGSRQGTKG